MKNYKYKRCIMDKLLLKVEQVCDEHRLIPEDNYKYMFICEKLTALEMNERVTWEELERCNYYIQDLFFILNLNFNYWKSLYMSDDAN